MPKYHVYGTVTGATYLGEIEAADEAAALKIAEKGKNICLHVSFCHACTKYCENAEITDIQVEEA